MEDPMTDDAGAKPFVMALMGPLSNPEMIETLEGVDSAVEVVTIDYFESSELRTAKGLQGGRDDTGLERPELSIEALDALARANGVLSMDLPENMDELAPHLQWWQGISAGYEHIDGDVLERMGVVQTHASGIAAIPIAEFVIGRLLQVWKGLRQHDARQTERIWELSYGRQVEGLTIGIIGLGAIGREVATRAKAFGLHVLATRGSAQAGDSDPAVDELFPASMIDDVLPRCDAVVLTLPALPEVEDLMDARRLALLPKGSILVNVARGMHVVEPALVAALESGHLGAAVLDVTRQEPLPADDPLWGAPNLYLSPHSSVSLDRYEATLARLAADNLARFLRNEPMVNLVNDPR
jgi:phosphoglycerate dehydrogenase-like enzyme